MYVICYFLSVVVVAVAADELFEVDVFLSVLAEVVVAALLTSSTAN